VALDNIPPSASELRKREKSAVGAMADTQGRIRDSKHGVALRHLPSGYTEVNTAWM
jgi:hypothetical protein